MALVTMKAASPRVLVGGRYRPQERLGRGQHGEAWCAHDEHLDRMVVIRRVLATGPGAARALADGLREGRRATAVGHPAVTGVHDVVDDDEGPWLVRDHVPGRTLATLVDGSALDPRHATRIGIELADALAAVHAAGVVHRGVSARAVVLGDDGTVTLTDFGVVRALGGGGLRSVDATGRAPFEEADDVWSLADTLRGAVTASGGPLVVDAPAPSPTGRSVIDLLSSLLASPPTARPGAARVRDLLRGALGPASGTRGVRRRRTSASLTAVAVISAGAVVTGLGADVLSPSPTAPAAVEGHAHADGAAAPARVAPVPIAPVPAAAVPTPSVPTAAPSAPAPVAASAPTATASQPVGDTHPESADTADHAPADTADSAAVPDPAPEPAVGPRDHAEEPAVPRQATASDDVPRTSTAHRDADSDADSDADRDADRDGARRGSVPVVAVGSLSVLTFGGARDVADVPTPRVVVTLGSVLAASG